MHRHTVGATRVAADRRTVAIVLLALVCLAATFAGLGYAAKPRVVYWSRVDVQFFAPRSSYVPNVLKNGSEALVQTAGAVERLVDPSGGKRRLADQSTSLASEGITHGWAVTLPNSGSQWSVGFAEPRLQVEAVGTTPAEATTVIQTQVARIHRALNMLQSGVSPRNDITLQSSPLGQPPIYTEAGSRVRALLTIAVVGFGATAMVLVIEVRRRRRRLERTSRIHIERSAAGLAVLSSG